MLKLDNLTKEFYRQAGTFSAVDQLSLEVKKGQIFGFIGLNGAGKTTTIKMIVGLLFPDKGQSFWNKKDSTDVLTKKEIGFMPEQPKFHRHLKSAEVLRYVCELFEISPEKIDKKVEQSLKKVGLDADGQTAVKNFSKGMSQRLGFACATINDPKLLILDEPLDGLDPIGRAQFKKLILEQKKLGTTVFLSSHILSDIDEICDEIAVIDKGKLVFSGQPKQLRNKAKSLEDAFVALVKK